MSTSASNRPCLNYLASFVYIRAGMLSSHFLIFTSRYSVVGLFIAKFKNCPECNFIRYSNPKGK